MAVNELAALGSFGGGAAGLGLGAKYLSEAWRNRRRDRRDETPTMTDAVTANATLVATLAETQTALRDERADNRTKDARIDHLEARCEALHAQIVEQRNEYDAQIRALQTKVFEVTSQLDELRRRLVVDMPDLPTRGRQP